MARRPSRRTRPEGDVPKERLPRSAVLAVATGGALGVLEGAIYPSDVGPRIALPVYWGVLAFLMWRLQPGRYGVALLPLALVVQDALSLLLQGMNPLTADWYADVFGRNVLTSHDFGVPNWYVAACALSLVGVLVVAAWNLVEARLDSAGERSRAPRAFKAR